MDVIFTVSLFMLTIMILVCLLKAIIGPRVGDRLVFVNMMGTLVIVIIAILSVMMSEGYLADICIIYAMISFLAVVVLCKVYMSVYLKKQATKTAEEGKEEA